MGGALVREHLWIFVFDFSLSPRWLRAMLRRMHAEGAVGKEELFRVQGLG